MIETGSGMLPKWWGNGEMGVTDSAIATGANYGQHRLPSDHTLERADAPSA